MKFKESKAVKSARLIGAFTLAELLMSVAILGTTISGVILSYVASAQRAEWNAHALAAQSLAAQSAEQARASRWDLEAGTGKGDDLGLTNFVRVETLDVPTVGTPMLVTNYVSITTISSNPPIRQIRSDCVWRFMNRGFFTNSVFMLRGPDQ